MDPESKIDVSNWKREDFLKNDQAWAIRELCVKAIRTLILHGEGEATEREEMAVDLEIIQNQFNELNIFPGEIENATREDDSPLFIATWMAKNLCELCGKGMPSKRSFAISLDQIDQHEIDDDDTLMTSFFSPSPDQKEFAIAIALRNTCMIALDIRKEELMEGM